MVARTPLGSARRSRTDQIELAGQPAGGLVLHRRIVTLPQGRGSIAILHRAPGIAADDERDPKRGRAEPRDIPISPVPAPLADHQHVFQLVRNGFREAGDRLGFQVPLVPP